MLDKDTVEGLIKLIDKLKEDNTLIIVEGYKDKKSLTSLGISGKRILPLQRKALFKVVEEVAKKEKKAVILTDLDKAGKRLYSKLNSDLSQRGIYTDNKLRNFLFRYTSLRQIEGLKKYIERNS
jgi:5S rRNA maturation endonuclease (ribonuclease M5)